MSFKQRRVEKAWLRSRKAERVQKSAVKGTQRDGRGDLWLGILGNSSQLVRRRGRAWSTLQDCSV